MVETQKSAPWEGWSELGIFDTLFTVRATRIYKRELVPEPVLARILRAATFAGSSGNTQPWEFVVVTDDGLKQKMHDLIAPVWATEVDAKRSQPADQLVDGAGRSITGRDAVANVPNVGAIVLVFWNPDRGIRFHGEYEENPDGTLKELRPHDGGRGASLFPACQNMILAARALGVQSLFTTFFNRVEPQLKELLGVPPRMFLECGVFLGYGDENLKAPRRKPLETVVHHNDWDRAWAGTPDVTI
ncbi:nitroreductase family protein [Amycolatopsis acidicola]|uniref:Nitroreductase family protein n=1 Tax=Amycolatopsis acidicola TaxID=2596893 RepID=A0A5N0V3F3_9PSEU|nr:nitroreductase family protein [Amycolatopsis acidicola]KAA9159411.1 nitroreductase family protein [Amycolatopsis acidicola]